MNDESVANHDNDDALMARLRSADPLRSTDSRAADSRAAEPRAAEPRASLVGDILAAAALERVDADRSDDAPVVSIESARSRRRPGLWMGVAAAAVVMAVVAGSFVSRLDNVGVPESAPPTMAYGGGPISLGPSPTQGAVVDGQGESNFQADVTESAPMQVGTQPGTFLRGDSGSYDFIAEGLSAAEGTAPAFAFDGLSAADPARFDALATALGFVEGPTSDPYGLRTYGNVDGPGPMLLIGADARASFFYNDPALGTWSCASSALDPIDGSEPCVPPGTPPGEDIARAVLDDVLVGAGWDPAAFKVTAETDAGSSQTRARAALLVAGQVTDMTIEVNVDEEGLASAYGFFADTISLGDYPVVSEQEAFERLSDTRFGAHWTSPNAIMEQLVESYPTESPEGPGVGGELPWPVTEVTIESARLGLATHWRNDGAVTLVPAYEFRDTEGGSWSVIALADSSLDLDVEPVGEPGDHGGFDIALGSAYGGSLPVSLVDFTSDELSTDPERGHAYTFDTDGSMTATRVAEIASVFGVTREPTFEYGYWSTGWVDGTGPEVTVHANNPDGFGYRDPRLDVACLTSGGYVGKTEAEPILPCDQLAARPADTDSEEAMRDILDALGVDVDDFEFTVTASDYPPATTVTARFVDLPSDLANEPMADPSGPYTITADFTAGGLLSMSGTTSTLVDLGEYDLVSADEAYERLSDPRFGARMAEPNGASLGPMFVMMGDPARELPAPPEAGSPVPWPIHNVHITDAELVHASMGGWGDQAAVIVPVWQLTDSDDRVWNVIAIVDSQLDFGTE